MIGLFSAPAVMRLPDCASTPVMSPVAVGQRFDFTCRVTCSEARAIRRPTEICGLFLIAISSACFKLNDAGAPGIWGTGDDCALAGGFGIFCVGEVCGVGAGGRLCPVCIFADSCAELTSGKANNRARNSKNVTMWFCLRFMDYPLSKHSSKSSRHRSAPNQRRWFVRCFSQEQHEIVVLPTLRAS